MQVERRIKRELILAIRHFESLVEALEDYEIEYRDSEVALEHLEGILAKAPFNEELHKVLIKLYDFEDYVVENL